MRFTTLALGIAAFLAGAALCGCSKSSSDDLSQAKRISINNLRQIGLAFHNFYAARSEFPPPGTPNGATVKNDGFPDHLSWRVNLLPYIEQDKLYQLVVQRPMAPLPESVTKAEIKVYQIPYGQDKATSTHFRVFVGNGAAFEDVQGFRCANFADFADGLSNTILVVEATEPVSWWNVDELAYDPKKPLPKLGVFPGGFHALMANGDVRWIPSDTPEKTIRAMITRAGGEQITLPGMSVSKQR